MEDKLDNLQNLLDIRREKYPNMVKFWEKYINIRKKKFEKQIKKAHELFFSIEDHIPADIPMETIIFLFMLSKIH